LLTSASACHLGATMSLSLLLLSLLMLALILPSPPLGLLGIGGLGLLGIGIVGLGRDGVVRSIGWPREAPTCPLALALALIADDLRKVLADGGTGYE